MNKIFEFDWAKVSKTFKSSLKEGLIVIRDGIAYWSKESGKTGIVQQMPVKPVVIDKNADLELATLMQSSNASQLTSLGLSMSSIVGAIVIQTDYLSQRVNEFRETIGLVALNMDSHQVVSYRSKVLQYAASVESARVLLLDKYLVSETTTMAENLLAQLSSQRHEVFLVIEDLVDHAEKATRVHLEHLLDLILLLLDTLAKTIYIESQLCDRYGKFHLSEHLMRESSLQYQRTLNHFEQRYNEKVKFIPFYKKKEELESLFNSACNFSLLEPIKSPAIPTMH